MYRQILDGFALNSLTKLPSIPDYHLMVGSAEDLTSQPLLVYKNANIPTEITKNMATMANLTNEEIAEKIADGSLEVNDINGNIASLGMSGV